MNFPDLSVWRQEIAITIILFLVLLLVRALSTKAIRKYASRSEALIRRSNLIIKYISVLLMSILIVGIIVIWGVDPRNIVTTLSAVVTVIGVALFAQWSILSNITSGVILLFSFPFKIGDNISIHDKDFPIEAEIIDIRTFYTLLQTREGEQISVPNNLLLSKSISIIMHPRASDQEFTD